MRGRISKPTDTERTAIVITTAMGSGGSKPKKPQVRDAETQQDSYSDVEEVAPTVESDDKQLQRQEASNEEHQNPPAPHETPKQQINNTPLTATTPKRQGDKVSPEKPKGVIATPDRKESPKQMAYSNDNASDTDRERVEDERKPRSYDMNNYETDISSDPLTAIRTLSRQCKRKLERAIAENRVIETSMCERAIEKLEEAERDIVDLRGQQSDALVHGDNAAVALQTRQMVNVKDQAFRAVHADLLLGDFELKALGIDQKHGRDRWGHSDYDRGGQMARPAARGWDDETAEEVQPKAATSTMSNRPNFGQDVKPVKRNERIT